MPARRQGVRQARVALSGVAGVLVLSLGTLAAMGVRGPQQESLGISKPMAPPRSAAVAAGPRALLRRPRSACGRVALRPRVSIPASGTGNAVSGESPEIPLSAKPVTVKLKDGEKEVYVIGISHVSRRSVDQTEALINAVKPDAVMLELCLARSGLLMKEEDNFGSVKDDRAFYVAGKIKLAGLPKEPGFPTEEEVLEWIGVNDLQPGQPLTRPNFDQLQRNLLNLGIFSSARIQADSPPPSSVPLYFSRRRIWYRLFGKKSYMPWELDEDAPKELFPVYPLGDLMLNCTERTGMLATIQSVTLRGDIPEDLGDLEGMIKEWFAKTKSTVRTFMLARKHILSKQPDSRIDFLGGETPNVCVIIQDRASLRTSPKASNTGMEVTVYDGKGAGIMPIQVQGYAVAKVPGAEDGSQWESERGVKWRSWDDSEAEKAPTSLQEYLKNPAAAKIGEFLIGRFGKLQDKAARKCKINPGEAWQTAFTSAVNNRAKMVVLGDQLALITQAQMATKLFNRLLFWFSTGLLTAAGGYAAQENPEVLRSVMEQVENPHFLLYGLAAAQVAGVLASLYDPVRTMQDFARQKGASIEKKVEVTTPLDLTSEPTLLEGEDALLNWPDAQNIVLDQRNEFMADTLLRMVRGKELRCPAYVNFQNNDSKDVLQRFLMGSDASDDTCPEGVGLGKFETPEIKKVVAVVGTAHVHGIREEFERLKREDGGSR